MSRIHLEHLYDTSNMMARRSVRGNKTQVNSNRGVWQDCFFTMSGRLVIVTWPPDTHPTYLILLVTGTKQSCWFVIRADRLNSSVQVCLAGSPHDYVTLLQVRLDLHDGVSYLVSSIFFFYFSLLEKMTRTLKCSLPCISNSLQCAFFLCVPSQYSKVYTVNDFQ